MTQHSDSHSVKRAHDEQMFPRQAKPQKWQLPTATDHGESDQTSGHLPTTIKFWIFETTKRTMLRRRKNRHNRREKDFALFREENGERLGLTGDDLIP